MQHAQANEVDTEEGTMAELKSGVDDEARHTGYDRDDGILRCDGDSHCQRPPGDVDPLRASTTVRYAVD